MIPLMTMNLILIFISFLFFFTNFILSKKSLIDREKMSPFECGFDPMSKNRIPFSIQFFLISLVFLIFDIEITILLPLIPSLSFLNNFMIFMIFLFFVLLLLGIYIEFWEKSLNWKK